MGTGEVDKKKAQRANAWSPRILLVQASEDRSRDYNAFSEYKIAIEDGGMLSLGCLLANAIVGFVQ